MTHLERVAAAKVRAARFSITEAEAYRDLLRLEDLRTPATPKGEHEIYRAGLAHSIRERIAFGHGLALARLDSQGPYPERPGTHEERLRAARRVHALSDGKISVEMALIQVMAANARPTVTKSPAAKPAGARVLLHSTARADRKPVARRSTVQPSIAHRAVALLDSLKPMGLKNHQYNVAVLDKIQGLVERGTDAAWAARNFAQAYICCQEKEAEVHVTKLMQLLGVEISGGGAAA